MVLRSLVLCMTMGAPSALTIQSSDGWYATLWTGNIAGSDKSFEWRKMNGSKFYCKNGGLQATPDSKWSKWQNHTIPGSNGSKVLYTSGPVGPKQRMLVMVWAPELWIPSWVIRECKPRSTNANCNVHSKTDCPSRCLQKQETNGCIVLLHRDECALDTRCVPQQAHFDANPWGKGAWISQGPETQGKCLAVNNNTITAETCDSSSKTQEWTFTQDADDVLV